MEIETNDNPQTNQKKKNIVFFAKLWINTVQAEGKHKGETFMSGNIDNKLKNIKIGIDDQIQIWKNSKRDGINPKTNKPYKDADFRVSLLTDQDVPSDINGPTKQDKEVKQEEADKILFQTFKRGSF